MPPKRGQKRKSDNLNGNGTAVNGDAIPVPPHRETWTGWVEMESEPAFFNVMLKEMGVRGAKVQEVISIDEDMLAMLPQPVHALIFLFRYKTQDEKDQYSGSEQDHIWFANQVPDFACATVATLNIVNNIPGLQMGKELRDFREMTKDMDPISRGEMIDEFAFVKRIHNSFARENDLLTADMHAQRKVAKQKKRAATAKAQATKALKKAEKDSKEAALNGPAKSARASTRGRPSTTKAAQHCPVRETTPASEVVYAAGTSLDHEEDGDFKLSGKGKPRKKVFSLKGPRKPDANLIKTEEDEDELSPRRSDRARKPPKRGAYVSEAEDDSVQEGFHFIAYMPIKNHVWKMDGLDHHPHDMGTFGTGGNGADGGTGNWMHVVAPALQNRMEAAQEQGEISFTLLAVVHDPAADDRNELCQNIKTLQAIDRRLSNLAPNDLLAGMANVHETQDEGELTGPSNDYDVFTIDIDWASIPADVDTKIREEDSFLTLMKLRSVVSTRQRQIRSLITFARVEAERDAEKAQHRRHDYGAFLRKWMSALAEEEVLGSLVG